MFLLVASGVSIVQLGAGSTTRSLLRETRGQYVEKQLSVGLAIPYLTWQENPNFPAKFSFMLLDVVFISSRSDVVFISSTLVLL